MKSAISLKEAVAELGQLVGNVSLSSERGVTSLSAESVVQ
jgi:hypothetical protein